MVSSVEIYTGEHTAVGVMVESWGGTNIDLDGIALGEAPHVALGEEAVGEQREEDEFGERQELVSREDEARPAAEGWSVRSEHAGECGEERRHHTEGPL